MGSFKQVESMFWEVKVRIPKTKGGHETQNIQIKYVRLNPEDYKQYVISGIPLPNEALEDMKQRSVDHFQTLINDYIEDWKIDEDGKPMDFNSDNMARVVGHPDYRRAIVKGFEECQNGGPIKN